MTNLNGVGAASEFSLSIADVVPASVSLPVTGPMRRLRPD
jgi:hypothetical protein